MSNNIVNRVKAAQSGNLPVNQEVTQHADGSGGPISINKQTSNQDEYKAENKGKRSWYDTFSDWGHTALDAAGMVPGIGAVADLANAGWYGAEGGMKAAGWIDDVGAGEGWLGNMGMAGLAAVPGMGQGVTAAKYAMKAAKAGKSMKIGSSIAEGWKGMNKYGKFFNTAIPAVTLATDVPTHIKDTKEILNRDSGSNTYLDNLNKNTASDLNNTNTPTDNKYENNQRTSNRVSQGTKSWSKGYSDWKGKGNTGSMSDFKTQANTWWDSDAGQRHAKSKGVKHRIKSV